MNSRVGSWLRLTWHDILAILAFIVAIGLASVAGDSPWLATVGAPLILAVWQIRQANVSESAVREQIQSELTTRNRELCEANILEALRQAVRIMAPDHASARANVMLAGDDERLSIAYHFNMASAPDHGMRFDKYQGCAGHAWAMGEQACADLEGVADSELRTSSRRWRLQP